jgi:hypothetical protein
MDVLPKLDRVALRESMRAEFERTLDEVADAVDKAAVGRVIRDSEEPARDALDRLRQVVFEKAIQLKIDAAQAAFPPSATASGVRPQNKGRQPYSVLTINGRIHLRRTRWHDPAGGSCTPTDVWIDAAEATFSEGVREMCCRINQGSTSFEKSAANLQRTAHVDISAETLRQLVEAEGRRIQQLFQQGKLSPNFTAADCIVKVEAVASDSVSAAERTTSANATSASAGELAAGEVTRIYLGCDGVKVPIVTDEEKKKRRAAIRQKRQRRGVKAAPLPRAKVGADCAYKEFRVVHFYDQELEHRFVQATSGDHEVTGRLMRRMAVQIDLQAALERIGLIDGAPWIRDQIELHGVVHDIGLDPYHLRDYAQKTRRAVFGAPPEEEARDDAAADCPTAATKEAAPDVGQKWVNGLMHTFHHEGYNAGWEQLTTWRATLHKPAHKKAANSLLNYVAERQPLIRFPEFRARGWSIGSGPTEAECKTTTHRVKGRGRRWDQDHAEEMMALACLEDSQLWCEYWPTLDPERN